MEVRIRSHNLVRPSSPTPDHLRQFQASLVDQVQPPVYTSIHFYYSSNGRGDDHGAGRDDLLWRLEESLSETLAIFYHFAGRYNDEDALVECNDLGVDYSVADVRGCRLESFLAGKVDPGSLKDMWSDSKYAVPEPLLVVRLNVFECGGIAIGLHVAHNIADIHTMLTFVKAWAATSRAGTALTTRPNFFSSSVLPPRKLPRLLLFDFGKVGVDRIVFSSTVLSTLRLALKGKEHPVCKRPPTRVEIATALISKVFANIAQSKKGQSKPMMICHAVSFRGRTKLPLIGNKDACGNLFLVGTAKAEGAATWEDMLGTAQESIASAVEILDAASNGENLCERFMESLNFREEASSGKVNPVMFTSWCSFQFYRVDFGMGKPALVGTLATPWESVTLIDRKQG